MFSHYKGYSESEHGAGVAYLEFEDGWPSRQVEIYGQVWRWGDQAHPDYLGEHPETEIEIGPPDIIPISSEEFEETWKNALVRCPPTK